MSILKTIAEKIKPSQPNEKSKEKLQDLLGEKPDKLVAILESILGEVTAIKNILVDNIKDGMTDLSIPPKEPVKQEIPTKKKKKDGKAIKVKPRKIKKEKPAEGIKDEKAVVEEKPAVRKDGKKIQKEKPEIKTRRKQKEKKETPLPVQKAQEPAVAAPLPPPQEQPPVEEEDLITGIIKFIFKGLLVFGGFVGFLQLVMGNLLSGIFGSGEDGFFGTMMKVFEGIFTVVRTIYKIVSPILSVVGTIIKEGILSIGQMWDEAKLLLMSDTLVMAGIRKVLGIKVTDEERKALGAKVYEGRKRKEERMKGYAEKVTGKKTEAPSEKAQKPEQDRDQGRAVAAAPLPQVGRPAPTPTVRAPAPTPAATPAAPPPAATRGAPAPAAQPAAAPAGPPPAPSIKPAEPTLGPPKKPPSPSFQEGKKMMLNAMDKEGITDPVARAQILAQTAHESGSFKYTQELGNAQYFQRYEGRKDLGNVNPGDGLKYIGRGFLQTTGRVNYQQFKDAFGVDVIATPEKLAEPQYAAQSALFWFKKNAKKVANMSGGDWSNTKGVTKAVNGGYNGLADRLKYFEMFKNDPEVIGKPASGGAAVAQAPASGQILNKTSAEVGSEKADRSRQPNVNVTYVDKTKVNSVAKTTQA